MDITWNDKVYEFDLDDLTMQQAKVIKERLGLTLLGLEKGLNEGDADALLAVYWLMHAQAGVTVDWGSDFKVIRFANAVGEAIQADNADTADDVPKD